MVKSKLKKGDVVSMKPSYSAANGLRRGATYTVVEMQYRNYGGPHWAVGIKELPNCYWQEDIFESAAEGPW